MRVTKLLKLVLASACLSVGFSSISHAALITATYMITAGDFTDSNSNPPPSPSTTFVSGTVTFTFDTDLSSQMEIDPNSVTGIDITDNDGIVMDYDETNAGVNTSLNIFTDSGRITFGGDFNSVAFMAGLSDDFRLEWDINLTTFEVTSVFENFTYVTTTDPFYEAGFTTVELVSVSAVPLPPALYLFALGTGLLGLFGHRRK